MITNISKIFGMPENILDSIRFGFNNSDFNIDLNALEKDYKILSCNANDSDKNKRVI